MRRLLSPEEESNLLSPGDACGGGPGAVALLVMVFSAPNNRDARDAIRETWGRKLKLLEPNARLLFLVGRPVVTQMQIDLEYELEECEDLVQEDFMDSYANLTLKTVSMLRWITRHCPEASYVLKTDDDMFIQPHNMLALPGITLQEERRLTVSSHAGPPALPTPTPKGSQEDYLLIGYRYDDIGPIRDTRSKWYLPEWLYPAVRFPSFLSGTAYLFSGSLVPRLYATALNTPYINLEDVFLTGLVASERLGLRLTSHPGFRRNKPHAEHACLYRQLVTAHELSPDHLRRVWKQLDQLPPPPFKPTNDDSHTPDPHCDTWWVWLLTYLYSWMY